MLLFISPLLLKISCRHSKHTADKCTCAWEFKKPFIFCFITLRCIQAKNNFMNLKCRMLYIFKSITVKIWEGMTLCSGKRHEQLCVHAFKPLCSKNFSLAYQTYPVNNSVSKFCLLYRLLPTFGSFFYTDLARFTLSYFLVANKISLITLTLLQRIFSTVLKFDV